MRWGVALLALLLPALAVAGPLDAMVALVLSANPVLSAERAELHERTRQRDWTAKVTVGWTQKGTDYGGASGANAGLRLTIPLFDRSAELDAAKARTGYARARDSMLRSFLDDAAKLREQAQKVTEADRMRRFYRDRLEYRRKQVDNGLADAESLWGEAERVQKADNDYREAVGSLRAAIETAARRYGGERWKRLRALLAEYAKPSKS